MKEKLFLLKSAVPSKGSEAFRGGQSRGPWFKSQFPCGVCMLILVLARVCMFSSLKTAHADARINTTYNLSPTSTKSVSCCPIVSININAPEH